MIIKRIQVKKIAPNITPQCSVRVVDKFSRFAMANYYVDRRTKRCALNGYNRDLCMHSSSYVIDGKLYCQAHAGKKALAMLEKK